ncbi:MAG: heavy metal-associated domain-containing protein [bacterium]
MRIISIALCLILIVGIGLAQNKKTESIRLSVTGMTCGGCASTVTNALKAVEGVQNVKVNLEEGIANVDLKPDGKVAPETLIKAVTEAGYEASLAKQEAPKKEMTEKKEKKEKKEVKKKETKKI